MFTTLPPTKIFLKSDGSLQILPLSTKFGEMELGDICQLAQEQNWKSEAPECTIERARSMVDSSCASPKEYALIELESQSKMDILNGIEYWIANINDSTAAIIHLNLEAKSVEVMITNLQRFTPIIHCKPVITLEQLRNLTHANSQN